MSPLPRIVATCNAHLKELVEEHVEVHGALCSLNHIDVSGVEDMAGVFEHSQFNGDISEWDVSRVVSMRGMLFNCPFFES